MIKNVFDIYLEFQKAQSIYLSTPFVIPKKIDKEFDKLPKTNQKILLTACGYFNTKWQNINISKYFECGFEIYSTKFTYRKILDDRILQLYIQKDKHIKRQEGITKSNIDTDLKYIEKWMLQKTTCKKSALLRQYCIYMDDGIKAPIKHFIDNKINKYTLVWLISQKYLHLTGEDKLLLPLIVENYWTYTRELAELGGGQIGY